MFTVDRVSPGRAVADACGLLLIVLAAVCVGSVYAFADLCGVYQAPHEDAVMLVSSVLAATAVLLWLSWLLIERGAARWVCLVAVVAGVLAVVAKVPEPWQTTGQVSGTLGEVVFHTVLGWLVLEVCRRHGISATRLGLLPQPGGVTDQARIRETVLLMTVAVVCFLTMDLIGWLRANLASYGSLPLPPPGDAVVFDSWEVFPAVFGAVVLEDVLLVGAVAALLHIARRPAWMIYTTITVIEVAFHLHYGLAALAFVPYALLRTWLFLRYGRLLPLLLGHAIADAAVLLCAPPTAALAKIVLPLALIANLWRLLHQGDQNPAPADAGSHAATGPVGR